MHDRSLTLLPVTVAGAALVALSSLLPAPVRAQAPANATASPPAAATSSGGGDTGKAAAAPKAQAAEKGKVSDKGKSAEKGKATGKKKVAEPKEEPEPQVADADEQQLLAAKEVLLGESGCEFNQKIQVDPNPSHPGYLDISFNKKKYMMKPVMSSTGALRLEDVRSETLMIQISSKTMLMNQKTGQRLVDNCVHPDQKVTTTDAEQVLMK